jgi:RNA polymerase sigma factor for flagellar operon FliA
MTSPFEEVLKSHTVKIRQLALRVSRGYGGDQYVDDMVSAGQVALWGCYQRFDSNRLDESGFWLFARTRVRGAMYDALRSQDHLGRTGRKLVQKEQLETIPWATIQRVPFATLLDTPNDSDPHRDLLIKQDREFARRLISRLSPRKRKILHLYFVEERTQAEIGKLMEISEGRVSQIRIEAVAQLKEMVDNLEP